MQSRALNYLWKFALTGIALLIFVMAIRALIDLTRTISWADIVTAMSQIPNTHLVLAFLVVAFGYIVLTLYDTIALMQLGRDKLIRYPKAALISFTAYAISHTIGMNLLTAGGIRYRHYNRYGLSNNEIANIVWLVSMAFTFGVSTLIGISLMTHPEITLRLLGALDRSLGIFDNALYIRGVGAVLLAVIVGTIVYAGRTGKQARIGSWRFVLPPARVILQQIFLAFLDLSTVALVLYLLLPTEVSVSYWVTFSALIQSLALGILSHVPGGLGVFEVTMISALPQVDKTQMLAVLLVFRLLYYIVPFLVALGLLLGYEGYLLTQNKHSTGTKPQSRYET